MTHKELFWIISLLIVLPQLYFYFKSIIIGETKIHIYTKIIWLILTGIWFIIQVKWWWWPWAWVLGGTTLTQMFSLILWIKYWISSITKFDTFLLVLALICIPLYLWIENKAYALLAIIFIDFLWYIPTYRKTYVNPYSESLLTWSISNTKYVVSIFALLEYSLYTLAYPIFLFLANMVIILISLCLSSTA